MIRAHSSVAAAVASAVVVVAVAVAGAAAVLAAADAVDIAADLSKRPQEIITFFVVFVSALSSPAGPSSEGPPPFFIIQKYENKRILRKAIKHLIIFSFI